MLHICQIRKHPDCAIKRPVIARPLASVLLKLLTGDADMTDTNRQVADSQNPARDERETRPDESRIYVRVSNASHSKAVLLSKYMKYASAPRLWGKDTKLLKSNILLVP